MISPLLSNLVLDQLDQELERRKYCFVRYADDCNILLCSQPTGRGAGEAEYRPLHYAQAQAQDQRIQERGGAASGTQVPRLQHLQRRRTETAHRRQGPAAFQAEGAGTDGADAGHQSGSNDEGVDQLFTRLEGLLRLLPDALGADISGSMDTASAAVRDLETMEAGQAAVRPATRTWSESRSGRANGRARSWPMADRRQPGHEHRFSYRLLRLAWSSAPVRWNVAQSTEPPYADPHVRWCGRRGEERRLSPLCRLCATRRLRHYRDKYFRAQPASAASC